MANDAIVPHFRPRVSADRVRNGFTVSARDWASLGAAANFVNGHGGQLIPASWVFRTISAGSSDTYNLRLPRKRQAVRRWWCLQVASTNSAVPSIINVNAGSASVSGVSIPASVTSRVSNVLVAEDLSSVSNTVQDVTLTITAPLGTGALDVHGFSVFEETRAFLNQNITDRGIDIAQFRARQPIASEARDLVNAYGNADARRAGYFCWTTTTADPLSFSEDSFEAVNKNAIPIEAAKALYLVDDIPLTCAVYARVTAANNSGEVRFSSQYAGDTLDLTVNNTAWKWYDGTLDVQCENQSTSNGLTSNLWENVEIEARALDEATLEIATIQIYRAPQTTPM